MGMLTPSWCKKLQSLNFSNFIVVFRYEKTCLSAFQALFRYKLLDSAVEKALEEDYSDCNVCFGRKKNKNKNEKNPKSSELQWDLEEEKKENLEG